MSNSNSIGMQLAPDGKIYITGYNSSIISCITRPDEVSFGCNFVYNYMNVAPNLASGGLPSNSAPLRRLKFLTNAFTPSSCIADSVKLTVFGDSSFLNYHWYFYSSSGSLLDSADGKNVVRWFNDGSYTVKLRAKNPSCDAYTWWMDNIYVNHSPRIAFGTDSVKISCATHKAFFSYRSTFADSIRFAFGDGTSSAWMVADSAGSVAHTYFDSSRVYRVVVMAKNSICVDSAVGFDTVVIRPRPLCGMQLPAPVVKGCVPFSFTITDTSRFADSVWYRVSGGGVSFISGRVVNMADTGTFSLVQYVRSADGCVDSLRLPNAVLADMALHADAGPDTVICKGQSLRLHASGGLAYAWKKDTTLSDTSVYNPLAWPGSSRVYYVKVSNRGCEAWDSVRVTVRDALHLTPVSSFSLCQGQSTLLFVGSSGGDTAHIVYTLSSPLLGRVSSHTGSFYLSPSRTDTFSLLLSDGCSPADSCTFVVTVGEPLKVHVPFTDTLICAGQSLRLTASALGGRAGTRVYDVRTGGIVLPMVDSSIDVSPSLTTLYYVRVSDGCSPADSIAVRVRVLPVISHALLRDTALCMGDTLVLAASPHGGDSLHYAFAWVDAASGTVLSSSPVLRYAPSVSCALVLRISDGLCSAWADTLALDVAGVLYSLRDTAGCAPFALQLRNAGITSFANRVYYTALDPGDGSAVVRKSFGVNGPVPEMVHVYADTGTFLMHAQLLDSLGHLLFGSFAQRVHVMPSPKALFVMSPHTVDLVYPVVTFQNRSVGADSCYWELGDGSVIGSSVAFDHAYTEPGVYRVRLVAYNKNGCSDTAFDSLVAGNQFSIFIPNAFSPNGDGRNEAFYPVCFFTRSYSLQVFDRWGQQVFSSDASDPYPRWVPGAETDGMYLYLIQATDGYGALHKYQGKVMMVR